MYNNRQIRQNRTWAAALLKGILPLLVIFAIGMVGPKIGFAQTPSKQTDLTKRLTAEDIQKKIDDLQQSKELEEAAKAPILALYREAMQDALRTTFWLQQSKVFRQQEKAAPEDLKQAKATLAQNDRSSLFEVPTAASLRELELSLEKAKDLLSVAKDKLTAAEVEPRRRPFRRREIESLLKQARAKVTSLERQQKALTTDKERPSGLLGQAQEIRLQAALEMSLAEIEGYTQELAAQHATTDLLPVQQDLANREVTRAKVTVAELKKRVSEVRLREAKEQIREAEQKATIADPALKKLAEENKALAAERQEYITKIKEVEEKLSQRRTKLLEIEKDYKGVQDKQESVGRTTSLAIFLKAQRLALPDTHDYRESIELRQDKMIKAQERIIELADERIYLAGKEEELAMAQDEEEGVPSSEAVDSKIQAERDLLQIQKKYIDRLARECNRYFNALVDIDTTEQELVDRIENYRDYIDEQVLWIQSSSPIWKATNWQSLRDYRSMIPQGSPVKLLDALVRDVKSKPISWIATFLTLVSLLLLRKRIRADLCDLGHRAEASGMQQFLPTAQATLLTTLLTIPIFGILLFLAWRMSTGTGIAEPIRAVGAGLGTTAILFLPLDFFRQVCRANGLAERHFGWPSSGVARIRSILLKLILLAFPLLLIAAILNNLQSNVSQDMVARLCFMVGLFITAFLMHFMLRRRGEVRRAFCAANPAKWVSRAYVIGYLLTVVFPLLLIIVAAFGYYFTAWHLASRWLQTVLLLLTLLVLGAFSFRWILVVRRRLAINRARQKREELQAAAAAEVSDGETVESKPVTPPDLGPDLATISMQARRLLFVVLGFAGICGVWLIWDDVFPALGILRYVPLWTVSGGGPLEISRTITLADLGWATIIAALTFIAARNIPGLLEMSLLHNLPMDKGLRFATTTVIRYLLVTIGIIWACSHIGLGWSKVQWILAAMSVGLGFGLQEIFANFVSGMVILFERPIRIGDIITIGDASGKVSKIQMRATTLIDWDKKELVVPNKEFATGRLLNWTLTDTLNRLVIDVGVSYRSDPDQVREILLQCAAEHPKVVDSPKPICIFREFGASALMFSLRIYLASMKGRLDVIHEMHTAVHRALREAGVEIAYPQLDLHVRSGLKDPEQPSLSDE